MRDSGDVPGAATSKALPAGAPPTAAQAPPTAAQAPPTAASFPPQKQPQPAPGYSAARPQNATGSTSGENVGEKVPAPKSFFFSHEKIQFLALFPPPPPPTFEILNFFGVILINSKILNRFAIRIVRWWFSNAVSWIYWVKTTEIVSDRLYFYLKEEKNVEKIENLFFPRVNFLTSSSNKSVTLCGGKTMNNSKKKWKFSSVLTRLRLIDWLIARSSDRFIHSSIHHWLIDWLKRLIDWGIDGSIDWLIGHFLRCCKLDGIV